MKRPRAVLHPAQPRQPADATDMQQDR
jgi:hypothetical protein